MLLALGALAACGEDPPKGPATIEIGTGALDFEPLAEGQELGIIAGPQGGYHFIINARIHDLLPGNPSTPGELGNPQTRFAIYLEDGTEVEAPVSPYRLGYREDVDGWSVLPSGRILQLDQDRVVQDNLIPNIYGQDVRLEVKIRDARGDESSDEVWIVATESGAS